MKRKNFYSSGFRGVCYYRKVILDEIKKFFKGDVTADSSTLDEYSKDYSIFKVRPQLVVFPKDAEDVKNLVKFVAQKKKKNKGLSLTARSGGTDMGGGPLNESIVVSFTKYFNRIKEIVSGPSAFSGQAYAVVEPGVYFRDFEAELDKRGLMYPPYPASKDICALGGMISNNSGGEKTLRYGKTEDYVEKLKVVLSDGEEHVFSPLTKSELQNKIKERSFEGEIYRRLFKLIEGNYDLVKSAKPDVSKNSAGYSLWNVWDRKVFDITKLIVGSQGTLGIVTEAKLKLVKKKKYTRLIVVFAKTLDPVPELVKAVLPFSPESIESYDDKTLEFVVRFLPELFKLMGGNIFKVGFQFLPEILMILKGGFPKMVVLIEFASDNEDELNSKLREVINELKKFKVRITFAKSEEERKKYWIIRRQSFKLLHGHAKDKEAVPFVDDVIVKPEYMPEFLPKINQILDEYKDKLIYTIAGHPGDGNFHIIPLADLKDPEVKEIIPDIIKRVNDLVFKYKGSITAEHNDGLIRSPYLKDMYGEKIYSLFEEVKKIFDPQGIFNPRKKVGGNLSYSFEHLK